MDFGGAAAKHSLKLLTEIVGMLLRCRSIRAGLGQLFSQL